MPQLHVLLIERQPSTTLTSWSVRETLETHERYFVGCAPKTGLGRIYGPIVQWDPVSMRGMTRSGRVYGLSGPPGFDQKAEYTWSAWIYRSRVDGWRDATADVIRDTAFADEVVPALIDAWTAMQRISQGTRYLVGYWCGTEEPLVSAPITSFSPATRCVATNDGLVYRLVGLQMMGHTEFEQILERFKGTDESAWIDVGDELSDQIFEYDDAQERKADSAGSL